MPAGAAVAAIDPQQPRTVEQVAAPRAVLARRHRRRCRDLRGRARRGHTGRDERGEDGDGDPAGHHAYWSRSALSRCTVTAGGALTATADERPQSSSPVDGPV